MSEIVLGVGTSHGPLLSTPPHEWDLRANVDRKNPALAYLDGSYDFPTLAAMRKESGFAAENAPERRSARFAKCQEQLDELGRRIFAARPDALVVVGDDHQEWFQPEAQPPFAIFHGKQVVNRALTSEEEQERISYGGEYSMKTYYPPTDEIYPCATVLAEHMLRQALADDFDVTSCSTQPRDGDMLRCLGHAYGFVYRRILQSRPIPIVPVLVNTYYPPNQPTARRCFALGRSIGRAIKSWGANKRVAVVASGGISHFVVDEAFDRRILDALKRGDERALTSEPEYMYRSGTSETKNWITVAGMLAETTLSMDLLDYVPCYRSEAGTGCAMAFATWQ